MVDPLLLKVFAYAYGPVVILAVMAFFWARHSNSPRLASVLRKSAVGSTDRCNTLCKLLCWRLVLQGFSWSLIELASDSTKLCLRMYR